MTKRISTVSVLVLSCFVLAGPARAEDQIIDAKPCGFFCKLHRNFGRDAQVSSPSAIDNGASDADRTPDAADGTSLPSSAKLAARPGTVMLQTPAEQAEVRRQKAKLKRETKMQIDEHGRPVGTN